MGGGRTSVSPFDLLCPRRAVVHPSLTERAAFRHSFQRLLCVPASGYRDNPSGALNAVGANGYCWASAPFSATSPYGARLVYDAGRDLPLDGNARAYGFTVRCVQHLRVALKKSRVQRCCTRLSISPPSRCGSNVRPCGNTCNNARGHRPHRPPSLRCR